MELLTIAKNVYRECSEFVHGNVIPELKKKNDKFSEEKKVKVLLCILEVHKNAPQEVKEALRIFAYSGFVYEDATGMRAARSELGTRYIADVRARTIKNAGIAAVCE
ncbi:MAG: hypothetical protein HFG66_13485 [Hungatella sp.]|nr:hypothetical protein [Hungatella sp.]